MALQAFRACDASGLARVDFLMEPKVSGKGKSGKGKKKSRARIFVNEINTLPGFTRISMYPKLWQASGVANGPAGPLTANRQRQTRAAQSSQKLRPESRPGSAGRRSRCLWPVPPNPLRQ